MQNLLGRLERKGFVWHTRAQGVLVVVEEGLRVDDWVIADGAGSALLGKGPIPAGDIDRAEVSADSPQKPSTR